MRKPLFILCLAAAAAAGTSAGAEKAGPAPPSPRIALVLSGGGARGAAHVGVLKVLEEMRVPVAFIAGTSMGSAVGGLYAAGLTARELEEMFLTFDWDAAFSDVPRREERSFRRKEDDQTFQVQARMGLGKEGIRLPRGLVEGQNFVLELRRLSHVVRPVDSFDRLPIPFRAMAADLATGDAVVLDRGDLVRAIRASIALSPLFTPIEIDGRLLADGGYLRNIPVDVAQAAGAGRLIVVDIGTPLARVDSMNSVLDVYSQTSRLGGALLDREQLARLGDRDLLIAPDLSGLSLTDFDKIPEFIKRGEAAARAAKDRLRAFSVSEAEYRAWRASIRKPEAFPVIHRIEILNGTRFPDPMIRRFLRQQAGRPLDPAVLKEDLSRVYGLGYFEWLDYHVEARGGENVLVVQAVGRSWGPNYLRLGVKINENFNGDSSYGLLARYEMTEINRLGAELQWDGEVGTNSRARAEYYQPLEEIPAQPAFGASLFSFVDGEYGLQNDPIFFNGDVLIPFEARTAEGNAGVGGTVGNWGRLKLGLGQRWEHWATPTLPSVSIQQKVGDVFARVEIDTLDKAGFPRRGTLGAVEARTARKSLGSDETGSVLKSVLGGAFSAGDHTVRLKGLLDTQVGRSSGSPYYTRLGGFLNLSGFPPDALFDRESALGQVQYLYRAGNVLGLPFYAGTVGEWGNAWARRRDITLGSGIWAGSVFAALDTAVGPVYLAYTMAEDGRRLVALTAGLPF